MPTKRREPPPHLYFVVSAIFHYLGPSFAVLLFARVPVLGVAWLRIASAAAVFALWRRPWRAFRRADHDARRLLVAWGAVLAVMNCCFYEAIDRLPLGTVAVIEFLPVIVLAAIGARTARNVVALALAVPGVYLLTDVRLAGEPLGVAFALANAVLFAAYIVLAHRVAQRGDVGGLDGLAAAMLIAVAVVSPLGGWEAALLGPGRAAGRDRRWPLVVGDPLRLGPAGDAPPAARDVRVDGVPPSRHRHRRRDHRARADPQRGRGGRRSPGRRGDCGAPRARG